MTSIGTKLFTWLRGEKVGTDDQGNLYYRDKRGPLSVKDSMRRERRWVVFAGDPEATRVPPEWHAWLHHTTDEAPPPGGPPRRPWMKEHQPNVTGTALAYRPPGHTLEGGARARATGDYEAWAPE
jgi:NADH:ubiquinone oxidoreductase subunit